MSLWMRVANAFRGARVNREIDEELEAHVAEAMASGRDAAEARRALGSPLRHREESRDARLPGWRQTSHRTYATPCARWDGDQDLRSWRC